MRKKRTWSVVALSAAMVLGGAFFAAPGQRALAADRDDLVRQQQEEQARIASLRADLEGVDVNLQNTFFELDKTRSQIPIAEQALVDAQNQLAAAEREAEQNAALLKAAQNELASIRADKLEAGAAAEVSAKSLGEFARASYRGDTAPSAIDLVLGASSAADFMNAYRINEAITRTQSTALTESAQEAAAAKNAEARQAAVEDEVTRLKQEADALVVKRASAEEAAQSKRDSLQQLEAKYAATSKKLEQQKVQYKESLNAAQATENELAKQIKAIDEENRRRAEAARKAAEERRRQAAAAAAAEAKRRAAQAQRNSSGSSSSNSSGSSSSGSSSSGSSSSSSSGSSSSSSYDDGAEKYYGSGWLISPIPRPLRVNSPMGYRIHPITGVRKLHAGVDLRSQCGQQQVAAAAGTVIYRSYFGTGGNIVMINHGYVNGASYVTAYMHLSAYRVSLGQHVQQGQVIGLTGTTGGSTGCHVHFEVRKNGVPQNPMNYIGY